ncbi:MAG: HEAT repeat domain-containing protein [Planctomycetes bacterium]|nr:HEAT repeat domain-containing protein [Planctomycetota bacterium]
MDDATFTITTTWDRGEQTRQVLTTPTRTAERVLDAATGKWTGDIAGGGGSSPFSIFMFLIAGAAGVFGVVLLLPRRRRYSASELGIEGDRATGRAVQVASSTAESTKRESRGPSQRVLATSQHDLPQAQTSTPASIAQRKNIEKLQSDSFDDRIQAMADLREASDQSAVPALLALLDDRDGRVREEAIYTLESLGDARAVDPIIRQLQDHDGNVRLKAARALGRLGDSKAVLPLISCLQDSDAGVSFFAAQALGQLGDKRATSELLALLKRADPREATTINVIKKAIAALGGGEDTPPANKPAPKAKASSKSDGNKSADASSVISGQAARSENRPTETHEARIMRLADENSRLGHELIELVGGDGGFGNAARIRQIGEQVYRLGGMDLMKCFYYGVRNSGRYFSQDIWDGIGSWRK